MKPKILAYFFLFCCFFSINTFSQSKGEVFIEKARDEAKKMNYEKAAELNLIALRHYAEAKDTVGMLSSYVNLSGCLSLLDKSAEFLKYENKILALLKYPHEKSSYAAFVLGNLYRNLGDFKKATAYYDLATQKTTQLKPQNPRLNASIFTVKGVLSNDMGDFEEAIKYFLQSQHSYLITPKENFVPDEMANCLFRLANAYAKSNQFRQAKESNFKSLRFAQSPLVIGNIYNNLAELYLQKQSDSALVFIKKAIEIQKTNNFTNKLLVSYRQQGEFYFQKNDKQGIQILNQAIVIADTLKDKLNKAKCYEILGKFDQKQGNLEQSIADFQKSLFALSDQFSDNDFSSNPRLKQIVFKNNCLSVLKNKISVLKTLFRQTNKKNYLFALLNAAKIFDEIIDYQRISFQIEESRIFLNESANQIYGEAIEANYLLFSESKDQKYIKNAFYFSEKSKSIVLNQALKMAKKQYFNGVPNELIDKEFDLNRRITYLENLINGEKKTEKQVIEWRKLMLELMDELKKLKESFKRNHPSYFHYKYDANIISLPDLQNALNPETAIVSYFFGEKILFEIAFDKEKVVFQKIENNESFNNDLENLIKLLYKKPALGIFNGSTFSQNLYNQLIKPIEKSILSHKRLVILRDAELNFLPFELLEKSANHYLLHDFAISYAYSATIWYEALRNKPTKSQNTLLSIAPYTSQEDLPATFRDQTLRPLPASGDEVNKIGGTIYTDKSATKNRFMEDYRKHGIIHFATHAQIDDTDPSKSFIAFYPEGTDYKLFTDELYTLDLQKTSLVVLSACEAGRGKLQKGEGLLSLARGFAYSGCPSVVTTLWNAHDESMAFLSERLHHYLQQNQPIDIALQQAKLDYFKSSIGKELDHPYYWANFILIGNYEPVNEDAGFRWWIWVLTGLILLGIVYLIWQKRANLY